MEATNLELYNLVLHDAPYVVGAYAIIWLALMAYVAVIIRRMLKLEREVEVLQDVVERKG
jgi:CcmD family protein